jgi:hypothetical protein
MSYEWATTDGSLTGSGPTVSWVAPEQYGNCDVTVTVKDGKGGIAQATITLSVVRNRDPMIASLVAEPDTVQPYEHSKITCVASDPDGDVPSYSWSACNGSITGVGNTATWIAPDGAGEYTITVTVDDGEGGRTEADVLVIVALTEKTITFTPVPNETGTVSSTGAEDTSKTVAGDSDTNIGYRAFWSFDLYSLMGTDVKDAKLTFTTKNVVGEPFDKNTGLGGLHILAVRYEPGQFPNFNPDTYSELAPVMWEPPTVLDLTKLVSNIGQKISASDHLQVEASFVEQTNRNHIAESVEWLSVTLTVTYKPVVYTLCG